MAVEAGQNCPCGSGRIYAECCQPYHQGEAAPTPEALMRSRYSAFAADDGAYLKQTWHRQTCPADLTLEPNTRWLQLQVQSSEEQDDQGKVSFSAVFQENEEWLKLTELSNFVKEQGRWYYVDGDARFESLKPGRNDPCPCASGKKFKKCCG